MKLKQVKLGDLEVGDVYYASTIVSCEYKIIAKHGNYVASALVGHDSMPIGLSAAEVRWVKSTLTFEDLEPGEFFRFVNPDLPGNCLKSALGYDLLSSTGAYSFAQKSTDEVVRLAATFTEVDG